jgi:aminotransferase
MRSPGGRRRAALSEKVLAYNGMDFDPEHEVTVTCGSTEAMIASLLAHIDPGDEVVIIEPFYENYGPDTIISGAVPRYVPVSDDFSLDEEALKDAFSSRTKGIVLNTPNNPTGHSWPSASPADQGPLRPLRRDRVCGRDSRTYPV